MALVHQGRHSQSPRRHHHIRPWLRHREDSKGSSVFQTGIFGIFGRCGIFARQRNVSRRRRSASVPNRRHAAFLANDIEFLGCGFQICFLVKTRHLSSASGQLSSAGPAVRRQFCAQHVHRIVVSVPRARRPCRRGRSAGRAWSHPPPGPTDDTAGINAGQRLHLRQVVFKPAVVRPDIGLASRQNAAILSPSSPFTLAATSTTRATAGKRNGANHPLRRVTICPTFGQVGDAKQGRSAQPAGQGQPWVVGHGALRCSCGCHPPPRR